MSAERHTSMRRETGTYGQASPGASTSTSVCGMPQEDSNEAEQDRRELLKYDWRIGTSLSAGSRMGQGFLLGKQMDPPEAFEFGRWAQALCSERLSLHF